MSKQRFSEGDVGAIIQRASALHAEASGEGQSLSLEEVEHIATEMGVPVEHVRKAAAELTHRGPQEAKRSFLSLPLLQESVVVDGLVDDEHWGEMVHLIRRHFKGAGETEQVGQIRYWSKSSKEMGTEVARTDVALAPQDGTTVLEISSSMPTLQVLPYLVGGLAGGGLGLFLSVVESLPETLAIAFILGGLLSGISLARLAVTSWMRREVRGFRKLGRQLLELRSAGDTLSESSETGVTKQVAPEAGARGSGGLLDESDLDRDPAQGDAPNRSASNKARS